MAPADPPGSPPSAGGESAIPKTAEAVWVLLETRPPLWEYRLFGGILWQGKQELALAWRDHQLRLPTAPYRRLAEDDVPSFLSDSFGELSWIIGPLSRVFEAQEEAFGPPGEPGDEQLIEHFADWITSVYGRLMEWAGALRSADPPEELRRAVELSGHAADSPIDQIREFIDRTAEQLEGIPKHLARSEEEREKHPLLLDLTLTLSVDDALMEEAVAELRARVGTQLRAPLRDP